jgi:hypothetical protein
VPIRAAGAGASRIGACSSKVMVPMPMPNPAGSLRNSSVSAEANSAGLGVVALIGWSASPNGRSPQDSSGRLSDPIEAFVEEVKGDPRRTRSRGMTEYLISARPPRLSYAVRLPTAYAWSPPRP